METTLENKKICRAKTRIDASLEEISNPKYFQLRFNEFWPDLFDKFESKILSTIEFMKKEDYTCEIHSKFINNLTFLINCSFKTNVTRGSILSVKINSYPSLDVNTAYFLAKDNWEIPLEKYEHCGQRLAWGGGNVKF
jgi:hypothetical protein